MKVKPSRNEEPSRVHVCGSDSATDQAALPLHMLPVPLAYVNTESVGIRFKALEVLKADEYLTSNYI